MAINISRFHRTSTLAIIGERRAFQRSQGLRVASVPHYLRTSPIRLLYREVDFYSKFTTPLIYRQKKWKLKNRHAIFLPNFSTKSFFFCNPAEKLFFCFPPLRMFFQVRLPALSGKVLFYKNNVGLNISNSGCVIIYYSPGSERYNKVVISNWLGLWVKNHLEGKNVLEIFRD